MKPKKPKKQICYVMMIARNFLATHPRKGQPTNFIESIENRNKIHTIRGNFELWEKRMAKLQKGEAYISLRYWSGLQRKSTQIEFKKLFAADNVGIEKLIFEKVEFISAKTMLTGILDIGYKSPIDLKTLANNDGLSLDDFNDWFASANFAEPMAIIHFSNFRYGL